MSAENFYLPTEVRAEPYHYKACGLDNIWLLNGYEVIEHDGERHVSVKSVDELHKRIGLHVVAERKSLSGKDIRFLRNTLDMTQAELAKALGTTAQTLARWEKAEVEIPATAERLLRLFFIFSSATDEQRQELIVMLREMVFSKLDALDEVDQTRVPIARFELKGNWLEQTPEVKSYCFA